MKNTAGCIPNYFSLEELDKLKKIFYSLPDKLNPEQERVYTNGIDNQHPLYPLIERLIQQRLAEKFNHNFKITVAMLLKESTPWLIHTDYVKGDARPDMAFLIPLSITGPENALTHTVMFKESCETNFHKDFIANNQPLAVNASHLVDGLCSHETAEKLSYVSLLAAFEWHVGDVLYWDRALLHCSDNFPAVGITEKQAIVVFTHLV